MIRNLISTNVEIKKIDKNNLDELQKFLNYFNDFFILCEGVTGSAEDILLACPASKEITEKLCLGAFEEGELIGFIDLIRNYPFQQILTIGYLLVHPSCRTLGIGTNLVNALSSWATEQGFTKIRVGVQKQNPKALNFWQKNGFKITKTIIEHLGIRTSETDVLERNL